MKIINPATEEVLTNIPEDTKETIRQKYKMLAEGQRIWSAVSLVQRLNVIEKFHELLDTEKEELAQTLTKEVGKPLQQSYNELNGARNRIRYFLDNSEKHLAEEWITEEGGTREKIVYEPLGVVANISAWNYPYLVGVNVFIPALIAGNTVIYKPSEYTSLTGTHILNLLQKAGVPSDCFQIAIGKKEVGEMLL